MAIILITSCVKVSAKRTKLTDKQKRIKLTLQSLKKWKKIAKGNKIVICDGSNYDFTEDCKKKFKDNDIECLYFQNNYRSVKKFGKGFGEGEIIKFALKNSVFLKQADFFAKCTGRLWVDNFKELLRTWNGVFQCNFILKRNKFKILIKPQRVDTRFYIVKKRFYYKYLLHSYKNVRDEQFNFLEHEFFKSIFKIKKCVGSYLFKQRPIIMGTSGTENKKNNHSNLGHPKKKFTYLIKRFIINFFY